jgi:hypothetical protein
MSTELNQLIHDVAESLPDDATPRDIAEAVVEKAGVEMLTVHLVDLIADRVADLLRNDRNQFLGQTKNRSSKLERRRVWWAKTLTARVSIGGAWKPLGDCTADDLKAVVSERKEQIKRVQLQINNYHHLIERMEKYKAATVADLKVEQVDL